MPSAPSLQELILQGELDTALDSIQDALNRRQRYLRELAAARTMATLGVGSRVELCNLRPQYLVGAQGTITAMEDGKVKVRLDYARGRHGADLICKPSMVKAVQSW